MRGVCWWLGLWLAIGGAAGVAKAQDDEPKDEVSTELRDLRQRLSSVKEWQGVWEVHIGGGVSMITAGGADFDSHYEETTHGSFQLKRFQRDWNPRRGILVWQGDGEATGRGRGVYSSWLSYARGRDGEEWQQSYQGSMRQKGIKFELWFGNKSRLVSLHPGRWTDKEVPRIVRSGRKVSGAVTGDRQEFKIDENHAKPVQVWFLGAGEESTNRKWSAVSGGSSVLEFTWEGPGGYGQYFGEEPDIERRRSRVLLFPVHDNLEVEVTIENYDDWRPKGTVADPTKPGNNLAARATLRNKDGSPGDDLPPVRRFIFELKDTSREPGVCLNWPLKAKDNDPDLRLVETLPDDALSQEDQKLIVKTVLKDDAQQPYAEAKVESYDFGGRAELRITCELDDGREVIGLLKDGNGGVDLVRLPKMDGPGWIARSWQKKHGVPDLKDNDDDEKVEGQNYKGDGFTLYEEYRGFVENGRHVEGDPKKKDLFILNLGDVATRSGVSLFEQLSKVRTHARLRDGKEITQEARVMNGNRRDGPHRVDQHGVVVSHVGMGKGGYAVGVDGADAQKAMRPATTKWVYVESPDALYGLFSADVLKRYHLEHLTRGELYATAVAHELAHAVGTDHHGELRMGAQWGYFQRADNPANSTKRPRFLDISAKPFAALWEDTMDSVAINQQAVYEQHVANVPPGDQYEYRRAAAEYWCNLPFFVGRTGGTDSGDEKCIMRYYFATAYEAKGKKDTFYVIRHGVKQLESALCRSSNGTGGNAASHAPHTRFGDATGGRGDCFGQICPNDAIPSKSTAIRIK